MSGLEKALAVEERMKNEALKEARKKAGLTVWEASRLIGLGYASYCGYETGKRYPLKKIQKRICEFYRSIGIFLLEEDVFPKELRESADNGYKRKKPDEPKEPEIAYMDHINVNLTVDGAGCWGYEQERMLMGRQLQNGMREAFTCMSPVHQKVIRMRFGIGEPDRYRSTLEEVGADLGVTRERIRQIEAEAMKMLRSPEMLEILSKFIDWE
jgi:RNA polymerase sigma factor (sigma-70 family)